MKYNPQFVQELRAGFPAPPQSYYQRINHTIALLQKRDEAQAKVKTKAGMPFLKAARIAAAACAAAVLLSACTFAVKPALAAELPLIGDAVYALSPTVSVNEGKRIEAAETVKSAAAAFAAGDYGAAGALFYQGDRWAEDKDTYLTAKYLHYILHGAEVFAGDGTTAETVSFTVTEASAQQKAFRFDAVITLELKGKDGFTRYEQICAELIETVHGLYITSVRTKSDSYAEYAAMCDSYGLNDLQYENPVAGIAFEMEYLSYMTVHKNAAIGAEEKSRLLERLRERLAAAGLSGQARQTVIQALEAENAALQEQITPTVMSAQELAAEVMYRYYLGRKLKEVQDFSDIMERNEATALFFYDAQLAVDKTLAGGLATLDTVEKGTAELLETIQCDDERMTVRFYVKTEIASGPMRGVGEDVVLTLEKRGAGWIVTGYDRTAGDGIYVNRLKPLAQQYKEKGLTWQEAGEKAYKELLAETGSSAVPASAESMHLITVTSNGETIAPYENFAFARSWAENGWLYADGIALLYQLPELADELPVVTYSDNFAVQYKSGVSFLRMSVCSEAFEQIEHNARLEYIKELPAGTYYIGIVVTFDGKYIESEGEAEYIAYECAFRLIME